MACIGMLFTKDACLQVGCIYIYIGSPRNDIDETRYRAPGWPQYKYIYVRMLFQKAGLKPAPWSTLF